MLDRIVRYLREHDIAFRVSSHPSPEPLPTVVPSVPPGGLVVDTRVLLVAGKPAVACLPRGSTLNLPGLEHELGAEVVEGSPADLPPPYTGVRGPIPPLGGAIGVLTLVDAQVSSSSAVVFAAFSPHDHVEVPFDELARLERPRIAAFAIGGELPEGHEEQDTTRKVA